MMDQDYTQAFETHYQIVSFSGTLEINCSKDIKIQGIIGPCTSLEKVGAYNIYVYSDLFQDDDSNQTASLYFIA